MSIRDCAWHLHLDFADGERACRTHICSRAELEPALEIEQDAAAQVGRDIIASHPVRCRDDQCERNRPGH